MFRRQRRRQKNRAELPLMISRSVLDQIQRTVGARAPETGGMLGGHPDRGVVTHFHFDEGASRTRTAYSPCCRSLKTDQGNAVLLAEN